ncbi:adenosylcobinamide-GDP ribazoletransferase [Gilvimarinus sp. 1_MG-2023]|uniref:adenosylcobinamide-GDP ribazoletransferase n=1 Tax=Gilvimarinus sp. 1_MG-2023 TaxID=3062638 RepID=UPI0026E3FFD6|nr:adenosylcobinamide-GDP ribazoletransferase [Gilvimarinus sp. 1_MG-2023]MDO6747955.1 adenosylcobinamide-GDP ribazoletransferase [Gilvimarinus sp. 1_MG-2023]
MSIVPKLAPWLQAFLYAVVFLTRLPVARWLQKPDAQVIARAVYFYPLVGVLLGILLVLFAYAIAGLGVWLAAALTIAAWVVLTGALHLDGLADCMDAYYAGHKIIDPTQMRERILQVMHDPVCGAVALVALVLLLLTKVVALASLWQQGTSLALLLVVPFLARVTILPFMALADYARDSNQSSPATEPGTGILWLVALCYLAPMVMGFSVFTSFVLLGALTALLIYWWRFWFTQIGGYTGDCLGALVELSELLLLILLVAIF